MSKEKKGCGEGMINYNGHKNFHVAICMFTAQRLCVCVWMYIFTHVHRKVSSKPSSSLIVLIVMDMGMCILNDFSIYELSTHDKWWEQIKSYNEWNESRLERMNSLSPWYSWRVKAEATFLQVPVTSRSDSLANPTERDDVYGATDELRAIA